MVVISGATLFFAVKEKEKEFHFLVFTAALLTLSFVFGELLRRLSLLSEEFKHKRTRYHERKPRFRHFVFFELFRGSAVVVPSGCPTALSCGNIGFKRKKKQECG